MTFPKQLMETNQTRMLPGCTWESQTENVQMPVEAGRPLQDDIISVYEVFVKDDATDVEATSGKPEVSVISALPSGTSQRHQFIQGECTLDLDTIDIISADGDADEDDEAVNNENRIREKDSAAFETPQSVVVASEENMVVYSHPVQRSSSNARLIDKDDPRSRLHYVKYLKRDGKTLKIWECGICSKEFRHQYTLMRHLPTHTDERNFKCDACGKAFRQLSTLSQHKAIHSDARPYICEFCKKTFNRVSTLISHRKTHSEHKPHKCHLCGKGFHQKGNLRNHVFTHTNERPYKCELCGKGFNQMSNLVCHKVKAHAHIEKMQYTCGICGKEFPRRFSLRSHEEYKHGIKYRQTASLQNAVNEPKGSKSKSVRVIHVPEDEQQNSFSDPRDKDINMTEFMENIIIDKIETKAMKTALLQGQTPFALFKPAKGIPVLVKVTSSGSLNHLLTPATADDLKMSGKMDSSSAQLSDVDGSKSVQIKVPVVATVTEKLEADGKINFLIEPPGPDQEQDSLLTSMDSLSEILPCDDDNYTPTEHFLNTQPSVSTPNSSHAATDEELLELAAIGGIQFVRATEDGRYEVMTNSEARDLMAQNSHDVKILGAEETEAINSVINVHDDLDYLPTSIEGKIHQHQLPEIILPNANDIMVLDPNNDQKALTLGDIEILEDKELRQLLDTKYIGDKYEPETAGITYLSPVKIDEILNTKPINLEVASTIMNENINMVPSRNELPNILNHRSDLPTITAMSFCSRNPQLHQHQYEHHHHQQQQQQPQQQQLQYQPYPLQILHEPIPFLKNSQNFNDELNAIFGEDSPPIIDYSTLPEYNPRLKLSEFEDDPESIFFNLGQSSAKVVAQKSQNLKIFNNAIENQHNEKIVDRTIENAIKIIEDKTSTTDLTSQFEDFRLLNTYDHFFKNTMYDSHFSSLNTLATPLSTFIPDMDNMKKDMQLLEKTLESKFFTSEDFENKANERQFKVLDQISTEGSYNHNGNAIANVLSNVENFFDKEQEKMKMDNGNFLQACSPCGPADFLYFENRISDKELSSSPSHVLEKTQKESEFTSGGLPDLDC
ncbi:PREDICTED: uncharacterized protein LOC105366662 [Ceratosolen solmsi marchali]|uniref:Uncharacterized protein LOC105366662 n=1 Tax=Ceratosolen solmsi marchali TaxID=326594 RepID=A0AAJ6YSP2_9HYME|nr:PREDICTED: uncharacterized protein LOC105366662 [Ceratosolen solmsi marchali]